MPMVAPGEASFPVALTTAPPAGPSRPRTALAAATAAAFTLDEAHPRSRITGSSSTIRVEDLALLPILSEDFVAGPQSPRGLADSLDAQVITGRWRGCEP